MQAIGQSTKSTEGRKRTNKEPLLSHACAFCTTPEPADTKEETNRLQRKARLNDGASLCALATMHHLGSDIPKDYAKAVDLYCRAAELGEARAYCHISSVYYREGKGDIVEKNSVKSSAFWEIAAKKGDIGARHNLGILKWKKGNMLSLCGITRSQPKVDISHLLIFFIN